MKTAAQAELHAGTAQQPAQSLGRGTILVTAASALFVLSGYIVNIKLDRTLRPGPQSIPGWQGR
jgi:hypothetical protein